MLMQLYTGVREGRCLSETAAVCETRAAAGVRSMALGGGWGWKGEKKKPSIIFKLTRTALKCDLYALCLYSVTAVRGSDTHTTGLRYMTQHK